MHNKDYEELNLEPIEDSFKKKFGNILTINQLNDLNMTIKEILNKDENFDNKYQNFLKENQLIFDNPSKTIVEIIEKYVK